jgi:uncharacterized protein (DUF1697 family)
MSQAHLALLRGINVGGKNKLPMSDLRGIFVAAGCRDVQTYIQSGNVIFRAEPAAVAALSDVVTAEIAARFGYRVPVVLRTADQVGDVVRNNPFLAQGLAEDTLHVLLLSGPPDARRVKELDPNRSPPDAFVVRGQEIYLSLPNGAARTKLTNTYFDTKLATMSTGRNWRTVTKLVNLLEG